MRFDHGFDAGHLERLSHGAEGGALYSTIAEQASAVLGMDKMDILEPRWVTDLNAMVDKATAAAGIGLTKTITDTMAASASTMLGMDKIGIPEPRWATDLNAMVDSAQLNLKAADQLLTWLQWAMNVDRPQVAWSGSAQCRGAGRRRAAQGDSQANRRIRPVGNRTIHGMITSGGPGRAGTAR